MYYYVLFVRVIDRFYTALFSALEQTHCAPVARDSKCVTVSFYSALFVISTDVVYFDSCIWLLHGCYAYILHTAAQMVGK